MSETKIQYGVITNDGTQVGASAKLKIDDDFGAGKFGFEIIAVGKNKYDAQIALHSGLQDFYEEIGDELEALRGELV